MSAQEIVEAVEDIFEFARLEGSRMDETKRQRDLGIELVLERQSDYRQQVEACIRWFTAGGQDFNADDVRFMCGDPPRGVSTNLVGALFMGASRAGLIRAVGWTHSARVIGHANTVRVWRGNA
jgi:hypothetical protein